MKKQAGTSFVTVLLVLTLVVFLAKIGMAVVPMYWDDKLLTKILENVHESGEIDSHTRQKQLKALVEKRMDFNSVNVSTDGMIVTRIPGGLLLKWTYEVRSPLIGNVDLVGRFHHEEEFN
ncbi:MAG: DUF4845 domain-containing protein [Oceanobacter sp.]